MIGFKEKM